MIVYGWMRRRGCYVSYFQKCFHNQSNFLLNTNLPSRVGLVLAWKNCTLHVERYGCLRRRDYCPTCLTILVMCAIFPLINVFLLPRHKSELSFCGLKTCPCARSVRIRCRITLGAGGYPPVVAYSISNRTYAMSPSHSAFGGWQKVRE